MSRQAVCKRRLLTVLSSDLYSHHRRPIDLQAGFAKLFPASRKGMFLVFGDRLNRRRGSRRVVSLGGTLHAATWAFLEEGAPLSACQP
jgi:hypothetical protein